jgi:tetratricopeptide (TPR) repeat protein
MVTTPDIIANLEKLVGGPRDNALLRYSLGNEYMKRGDAARAADCFSAALAKDPHYSAAWKLLGKALADDGRPAQAVEAYRRGIEVAEAKGDKQAAREMAVFSRRIEKVLRTGGTP